MRPAARVVGLAAALAAAACSSAAPSLPHPEGAAAGLGVPHLEERALLLFQADQRIFEPFILERAATSQDPALRRDAAIALGRIGARRGRVQLEELLVDSVPEVRRAAAFSLGLVRDEGAAPALLRAARDPDLETGSLAVEALAKLGAPLAEVAASIAPLTADQFWPRLLPHLFRFQDPLEIELASRALERNDPALRARAAYALGREAREEAAPALRTLLADPDAWVRGWAARGLGQVGQGEDLPRLRPLLDDPVPGPPIQALRAARALVLSGRVAAPTDWMPRLLELLADERPGLRATVLEVSGAWLLDERLAEVLVPLAEGGEGRERELALLALAEGRDPRAVALVARAARSAEPQVAAVAAEAAGRLSDVALLAELARHAVPSVRAAAFSALLEGSAGDLDEWLADGLSDPDAGVRARCFEWLAESPRVPGEALFLSLRGPVLRHDAETRAAGVRALAARAEAEPLERGALVVLVEELARDPAFLVRREAVAALGRLDRPQPAVGPAEPALGLPVYRDLVLRSRGFRYADLHTARGTIGLRLHCELAPRTCLSFLQLAAQGFYDGLPFHRVVPDFVVQAGDPRGDGSGGPGYTLRDEINRLRYGRGVLGMALSGPDTGGSQFFITLSPQPHLDGGYTAFGEVVSGHDVLDRLVQGDRILGVVEVEAGAR